jgi:hypothetical protein
MQVSALFKVFYYYAHAAPSVHVGFSICRDIVNFQSAQCDLSSGFR